MATEKKINLSENSSESIPRLKKARIGIVVSEWNDAVTNKLLEGAIEVLHKQGIKNSNIYTELVPGSFELPMGAQFLMRYKKVDAIICLGCVIQGETRHFEFISNATANAISVVALNHNTPVIFGVLTTDTMQQAMERAGGTHGNKGNEAAVTAIKMIALKEKLKDY
jgi:6,7-dimethyl-8-ribityllumazine synthase